MPTNEKGRAGWHQATLNTSNRTCNSTGLAARVKGFSVTLASPRGRQNVELADWFILLGGTA